MKVIETAVISKAFQPRDVGKDTRIVLLPLDGSKETIYTFPGDVYFTHVVNTYENGSAVIFDVVAYDSNPFEGPAVLSNYRNKTLRDQFSPSQVLRWVLHTAGPRVGKMDSTPLAAPGRNTDFTQINRKFGAAAYCLYWAVEWRHDDVSYASMAIVRQNVCNGQRSYWHRANAYPSEPTFVPRKGGAAEDDGVLIFSVLNGTSGTSTLMELDAASMEPLSETSLGGAKGGFTTHGEWYEGLLQ